MRPNSGTLIAKPLPECHPSALHRVPHGEPTRCKKKHPKEIESLWGLVGKTYEGYMGQMVYLYIPMMYIADVYPIGCMYGVFTYISLIITVHVGKCTYISYIDPFGIW